MIQDPRPLQELIRSRCSTRQFLLSRTDPSLKKDRFERRADAEIEAVMTEFPGALHEQEFLAQAETFVQPLARFDALAVRIDHFLREVEPDGHDPMKTVQAAVARAIDQVCRRDEGLWGILDVDIFGLFLSGRGPDSAKDRARQISDLLSRETEATISVGMAVFPTLEYDKAHILENALKALDHAAFFGPNVHVAFDAVSLNISGDQLYQEGNLMEAVEEYRLALKLDPGNVNILNSLGVCHGVLEEYDPALKAFDKVLHLNPKEVMAIYNTGIIHMLRGDKLRALDFFKKAAKTEPDIFEVMLQAGRTLVEIGETFEGVAYLKRAVELNPEIGAPYRYLGEAYQAINDLDLAMTNYRHAIKKNPNDAASLSAMGAALECKGEDLEIAELFCRQSVEIEPENGLFQRRLGLVLLRQNKTGEALQAFEDATRLGNDCSALLAQIGSLQNN